MAAFLLAELFESRFLARTDDGYLSRARSHAHYSHLFSSSKKHSTDVDARNHAHIILRRRLGPAPRLVRHIILRRRLRPEINSEKCEHPCQVRDLNLSGLIPPQGTNHFRICSPTFGFMYYASSFFTYSNTNHKELQNELRKKLIFICCFFAIYLFAHVKME